MKGQCYMFLLRGSDFWKSDSGLGYKLNPLYLAKNIVRGDSLDMPFVNFIRVQSVGHEIAFGDAKKLNYSDVGAGQQAYMWWNTQAERDAVAARQNAAKETVNRELDQWVGRHDVTTQPQPGSVFGHLPDHKEMSFTKYLDAASPQLAFGASAQEKFPLAAFFFRRKIGLGLAGVRAPYMVVGLRRVMVSGWKLKDDSEEVKLRYEKICWIATTGLADTNLPQGFSIRYWDRDKSRGGEAGLNWTAALATLTAALVAAGGAISGAAGSFD